jgi:hypothetical protein
VGYGDFRAYGIPEAVFLICYMTMNIALGAYILGTITLLVVKGDEATGKFRDKMHALESYAQASRQLALELLLQLGPAGSRPCRVARHRQHLAASKTRRAEGC